MATWTRQCQECGNIQTAIFPSEHRGMTDSYANSKCRKCKSETLDYGSYRELIDGKYVKPDDPEDNNED